MTTPTAPVPMTSERLEEIRETKWSIRSSADMAIRELFAHIDAQAARIAELEQENGYLKIGDNHHQEQYAELQAELAAARKPPEGGEVQRVAHCLDQIVESLSAHTEAWIIDVAAGARNVITRQAAALAEAERKIATLLQESGSFAFAENEETDPLLQRALAAEAQLATARQALGEIVALPPMGQDGLSLTYSLREIAKRALQQKDTAP